MPPRRLMATLVVLLMALSACSGSSDSASGATDGKPAVVASTSMWAAVARQVAGEHADVTAIIDNPQQDPHDFESSAQNKLVFAKAAVTVVNGGGYDDWATSLASKKTILVNAVEVSGIEGAGQAGFNEHVWYSPVAARAVATQVSEALSKADPDHSSAYAANLATFTKTVGEIQKKATALGAKYGGTGVAATEPVAAHLFAAAGLSDLTPEAYIEQSESDAGPSVAVVNQTVTLIGSGKVHVLAINAQTSDPVSDKLIAAAKKAGVPTFEVYEVLPNATMTYTDFLSQSVDSLTKALNQ